MSDEDFQKELEIVARILVASPKARRAVKLKSGSGADYLLEDMATNQPVRLVNVVRYNWPYAMTNRVFGWADRIRSLQDTARRKGNLPASLFCYWADDHWGVVNVPGPFEMNWAERPHKENARLIYTIPLKDFSILVNYADKSNKILPIPA